MRRSIAIGLILAVAAATAIAVAGRGSGASGDYRVDALFDTAKGLIKGNQVMMAGARVGTVTQIRLTPAYKARVEMRLDADHAPFYANARCQIRPVALIGEMEINCDPGLRRAGRLVASGEQPPTVPVTRTTVPVDFTDLFNIWSTPVDQRLSETLWTLGAAVAGRGEELNAVLRRTNPALTLARETIGTLNQHRAQLATLLSAGVRTLAPLAADKQVVPAFIDHAARVTASVAAHRGALHAAIGRLPALLDAVDTTLPQLDAATAQTAPLLRDLRAGAPGLAQVAADIPPLARAAGPTLQRLGRASVIGRKALPELAPVIVKLAKFAHASGPVAHQVAQLFTSMRTSGFVENLNSVPYYFGAALSRFDSYSHLASANFLVSSCAGSVQSHLAGCSPSYGTGPAKQERPAHRPAPVRIPGIAPPPPPTTTAPRPAAPPILGGVGAIVKKLIGGDQQPSGDHAPDSVDQLLDYLLK